MVKTSNMGGRPEIIRPREREEEKKDYQRVPDNQVNPNVRGDQMKEKCNSIYDLARIAGVSYGTVSRVLNGRGNVSPATRQVVLEAATRYNFKPRMQARKPTVGFLLDLERSIAQQRAGYIETVLLQLLNALSVRGVTIEIFTSYNRGNINGGLLDGLISLDDNLGDLAEKVRNIPVLVLNGREDDRFSRVVSDHFQSGILAAEYLRERQCRRCAILLDSRNWGNLERQRGFLEMFPEAAAGFVAETPAHALLHQMVSCGIDGLFLAGEDNILEHLNILDSVLPADRPRPVLVTMENPSISRFLNPPLTTVAQPFPEMVRFAAELISEQILEKQPKAILKIFPNTLIRR